MYLCFFDKLLKTRLPRLPRLTFSKSFRVRRVIASATEESSILGLQEEGRHQAQLPPWFSGYLEERAAQLDRSSPNPGVFEGFLSWARFTSWRLASAGACERVAPSPWTTASGANTGIALAVARQCRHRKAPGCWVSTESPSQAPRRPHAAVTYKHC